MPTVIDSLLVNLGLDPSGFTAGSKRAREELNRTSNEAVTVTKNIEASGKKAAEYYTGLTKAALGFFAVMAGGREIKRVVSDVNALDAATGRFAANLGMTPQRLGAWEQLAKRFGGTADGIRATLQGLSSDAQQFLAFGTTSGLTSMMNSLGIDMNERGHPGQAKTAEELAKELSDKLAAYEKQNGRPMALALAQKSGLTESDYNMLRVGSSATESGLRAMQSRGVTTPQDAQNAQGLQVQEANAAQSIEDIVRQFTRDVDPLVEASMAHFDNWIQKNKEWIDAGIHKGIAGTLADIKLLHDEIVKLDKQAEDFFTTSDAGRGLRQGLTGRDENPELRNLPKPPETLGETAGSWLGGLLSGKRGQEEQIADARATARTAVTEVVGGMLDGLGMLQDFRVKWDAFFDNYGVGAFANWANDVQQKILGKPRDDYKHYDHDAPVYNYPPALDNVVPIPAGNLSSWSDRANRKYGTRSDAPMPAAPALFPNGVPSLSRDAPIPQPGPLSPALFPNGVPSLSGAADVPHEDSFIARLAKALANAISGEKRAAELSEEMGSAQPTSAGTSFKDMVHMASYEPDASSAPSGGGSGDDATLNDLIARAEDSDRVGGYNATYGGGKYIGRNVTLTDKSLDDIDALQGMLHDATAASGGTPTSAIGRYMFERETLQSLRKRLHLRGDQKFSPELQDMLRHELTGDNPTPDTLAHQWSTLRGSDGHGAYEGMGQMPNTSLEEEERALGRGRGVRPGQLVHAAMAGPSDSSVRSDVRIGSLTIQTRATDARQMAMDARRELRRVFDVHSADTGLV